jgi:hypothetical protein
MRIDMLENISSYENGDMSQDEEVVFFQELVDSGMAWHLQGHYGRHAMYLAEAGLVTITEGKNEIK